MKPQGKRIYVCPGCKKKVRLKPGNHWCNCNELAPFRMVDQKVINAVDRVLGRERRGKGQADPNQS